MAEQIHYSPAEVQKSEPTCTADIAQPGARATELNALLDELSTSGILRWLTALVGALPEVSTVALKSCDTAQGRAGINNLMLLVKQLGRIDPAQLAQLVDAVGKGLESAAETASGERESAYRAPGLRGVVKLLRDEELWHGLAPILEAVKASAAADRKTS